MEVIQEWKRYDQIYHLKWYGWKNIKWNEGGNDQIKLQKWKKIESHLCKICEKYIILMTEMISNSILANVCTKSDGNVVVYWMFYEGVIYSRVVGRMVRE